MFGPAAQDDRRIELRGRILSMLGQGCAQVCGGKRCIGVHPLLWMLSIVECCCWLSVACVVDCLTV